METKIKLTLRYFGIKFIIYLLQISHLFKNIKQDYEKKMKTISTLKNRRCLFLDK